MTDYNHNTYPLPDKLQQQSQALIQAIGYMLPVVGYIVLVRLGETYL